MRGFHRQRVLRRARENLQLLDLSGNGLDHLNAGGTDADHADALVCEIQWFARPAPGMEDAALEALLAGETIFQRRRKHAAAADEKLHIKRIAGIGAHQPASARLVEL